MYGTTLDPGTTTLHIGTQLDARTVAWFEATCKALLRTPAQNVVLDFSETDILDMAGLWAILKLQHRLMKREGCLACAALRDTPKALLRLSHFDKFVLLFDTVEEALTALGCPDADLDAEASEQLRVFRPRRQSGKRTISSQSFAA